MFYHFSNIFTQEVKLSFTSAPQLLYMDQARIINGQQSTHTDGKCEIILYLYVVVWSEGEVDTKKEHAACEDSTAKTCRGGYSTMPKDLYCKGK